MEEEEKEDEEIKHPRARLVVAAGGKWDINKTSLAEQAWLGNSGRKGGKGGWEVRPGKCGRGSVVGVVGLQEELLQKSVAEVVW